MANVSKTVKKSNLPKNSKKQVLAENERNREKALLIYTFVRFDGMTYAQAWRTATPHTKCKSSSGCSAQGKRYYDFAKEHYARDVDAMLEAQGIDPGKVARKIAELMEAQQFRTILGSNKQGKPEQRLIPLPDNRIQLDATKAAAEMLGIKGEKTQGASNQTLVVFQVGTQFEKPEGSGQ